jgi:hypothetical protein
MRTSRRGSYERACNAQAVIDMGDSRSILGAGMGLCPSGLQSDADLEAAEDVKVTVKAPA